MESYAQPAAGREREHSQRRSCGCFALAGESGVPANGALNFDARIAGTVGNPQGAVDLTVANGSAYGEPFDRLQMAAALTDQRVDLDLGGVGRQRRPHRLARRFQSSAQQLHNRANSAPRREQPN